MTPTLKAAFEGGAHEMELAANVHFVPRTNEKVYILVKLMPTEDNHISWQAGGYWEMGLHNWQRAQVCHELGHGLGLAHEQTRKDRDASITVQYNNIEAKHRFEYDINSSTNTEGAYDFLSVMHFSDRLYSVNPPTAKTMLVNSPNQKLQSYVGTGGVLSVLDRAGLAKRLGKGPQLSRIVTNTQDTGVGSLRAALYYAADHPGTTILFRIPKTDPGFDGSVFHIRVNETLPSIVSEGTVLDGSTQRALTGSTNGSRPKIGRAHV